MLEGKSREMFDEAVGILQNMGLNDYESKVYAAVRVSNRDKTKASDLSKLSGVPRTRVYSTLKDLSSKGYVKRFRDRPMLFAPGFVTPGYRTSVELERKLAQSKETSERVEKLFSNLNNTLNPKPDWYETHLTLHETKLEGRYLLILEEPRRRKH